MFAGWLRYVMGVDDNGQPFTPSDDPMLAQIQGALAGIRLGDAGPFGEKLHPVLSNERIFGVDLYAAGLGELTENYFAQLVAGPGAVRSDAAEISRLINIEYCASGERRRCRLPAYVKLKRPGWRRRIEKWGKFFNARASAGIQHQFRKGAAVRSRKGRRADGIAATIRRNSAKTASPERTKYIA